MESLWPFPEFLKDKSRPYVKTTDSWMEPVVRRPLDYKENVKNVAKGGKARVE
ncbi:hypothetical protein BDM02DRAFT_3112159 [Thelephora ganbajun]|uniref:Uncharacterized protein n=1 Tax=Thelephora ganbajun TaxID=370292 RepID=A0ACB6ZKQ3_THEGA|nr:hypothetical protein BDM02DRAFT_3112159 [Thelephora ganbajun]